ncbi:PREDICTED: mitochondrial inner membrane protein OXA1-like isoform X1 [Tarenaya hassleriana]|uniref:mitochondrial inner membrane protein OXA1-like isoform X1 n=1 Tax=Tarenaya hassleriana TaxID=28532 RepID=UPI00053C6C94|nr:PREDICTED: mitochondrial inner membrane protein OXA1-like isoform X1 [Tarenaya hassleriana]XP_010544831.1 PREDICTED: mitochondrial inner membrane protein OXA1-like isoform X1 [Tarenaya hassleriana]
MASLHGVSRRVQIFQRRFYPSCGHLLGNNKDDTDTASQNLGTMIHKVLPHNGTNRLSSLFRERQYRSLAGPVGFGFSSCRHMSSTPEEWSDKVDGFDFAAEEIIPDGTIEAVASSVPVINEVAIAAADSFYPVAALQYLVDGVHSFTGLNWWASIVMTTLIIRGLTVPAHLNQLKATFKLEMLKPRLEELREEMNSKTMDPETMADGKKRMQALFHEYGVTPLTPLKGVLIQGTIFVSFFFAIRNMAEKVPSFKSGGTLWFTDLSIPDSSYVLPLLTALTYLITVECDMAAGHEGNPMAGTMKKVSRILSFVLVPVMMSFETALFGFWLTSNLFSIGYGLVLKRPEVRRLLNIPILGNSPTQQSPPSPMHFPFSPAKEESVVRENIPIPSETSRVSDRRISRNSVLRQRMRTLQRQIKDIKNSK